MRRTIPLVLIAVMSACSTVETVPPVAAEVCAQPGLWAVLSRPRAAEAGGPPKPLSGGSAAAAGAKTGGLGSLAFGMEGLALSGPDVLAGVVFLAAGVVIAPVAAIVGAGAGVASAHSEAEIAAAQKNMASALEAAKPADAVRSRIVALADQRASRRMHDCGDSDSVDTCRQQSPEPVAVVLEMTVSPPYFEAEGAITPDLRLLLSADVAVIRASDAATIYRRAWAYRGRQHGYFDLVAGDAALFRAELETAVEALAGKIVDDLVVGGRPEVHETAEQPEGSVWTVIPPDSSENGTDCP